MSDKAYFIALLDCLADVVPLAKHFENERPLVLFMPYYQDLRWHLIMDYLKGCPPEWQAELQPRLDMILTSEEQENYRFALRKEGYARLYTPNYKERFVGDD